MSKNNLHNRKSNDGFRGLTHVVCKGDVVSDHTVFNGRGTAEQAVQGLFVVSAVTQHEGETHVTVIKLRADGSVGKRCYRSRVNCPGKLANNTQFCVVRQMRFS